MSIKKSQKILKCFVDLKSSVWFTLGSENETMFCDTLELFSAGSSLSPFRFPLSSFSIYLGKIEATSASRVDCRLFSVKNLVLKKF